MWNTYNSYGYSMHMPYIFGVFAPILLAFVLIVIALKGYCLWHAARRDEKWWFIALLVINTAGILELVYIIFFLKKFSAKTETQILKEDHREEHINESK
jgi:methionyl-tRNA synthetase